MVLISIPRHITHNSRRDGDASDHEAVSFSNSIDATDKIETMKSLFFCANIASRIGNFGNSRALRAFVLAWCIAWFGPAANLSAGTLNSSGSSELIGGSAQPFGLLTSVPLGGELREKWLGVARQIDDEILVLTACQKDRTRCASPAALQFLTIVDDAKTREGRARLGGVNRAINLAIKPMSDFAQYGTTDVWSSPLVTLAKGAGDCEDYAIAKFVALRQAGISPDDLRVVILRDTVSGEDHAVAAARLDGRWLTLDNRRMAMVEDTQIRNYRPIFVIEGDDVKRYSAANRN